MSSLENLAEQITRLPQTPGALHRRIELCRQVLKKVDRKTQPILWAQLHVELGLCLHQMSHPERARHLEEAIEHFKATRTVYTRQDHAEAWAETTHDLATIYAERIRGDRAENLEQAIHLYDQALEVHTRYAFPEEWASTKHNLANVYVQRIRGDRAENLEQAVALYRDALSVWTRERFPFGWAQAQKGLGMAYFWRVRGGQSDNLQTAIVCLEKALTVWTRQTYPPGWAEVQEGLGLAWRNYVGDDPAANVERAITCHQAALGVWDPRHHPWEWARVQHNLGTAWRSRLQGNRAENLEKAVQCYERALEVRTREAHPEAWAETTYNLAIAYSVRFTAESVEEAIRLHEQVLEVYTRQAFPLAWARTQTELGSDYIRRIRGERVVNLEKAIRHHTEALQAQSPETCPQDWAMTQQSLAVVYSERLVGDRVDNLRRAIVHYEQALRVFDKGALTRWATVQTSLADTYWKLGNLERAQRPEQAADDLDRAMTLCLEVVKALDSLPLSPGWALAHYNLGNAYGDRIRGDRGENQERAIKHYTQALKFYTPQAFPGRWANAHNNLAVTYWELRGGNRVENLVRAIQHFNIALEFATPEAFPVDARRAARNLGNLHFEEECWSKARAAYDTAIRAAEILYRASYSPGGKGVELAENTDLYQRMVQACLEEPDYTAALVAVEGGKARTFLDQMGQGAFPPPPGLPADLLWREKESIRKLREQEQSLATLSGYGVWTSEGQEPSRAWETIEQRRTELAELETVWDKMARDYPAACSYVAMRRGEPMTWDDLCALAEHLGSDAALVEFYTQPDEVVVFVLRDGWDVPRVQRVPLNWQGLYYRYLLPYQDEVRNHESGCTLTHDWLSLGEHLLAPLRLLLEDVALVYFVPHGLLHYLPLHALTVMGEPFITRWAVAYAPSAAVLARTLESAPAAGSSTLVMGYTHRKRERKLFDGEAKAIAARLHTSPRLGRKADAESLRQHGPGAWIIHLSCHGQFRGDDPAASCVYLASGEFTTHDWMALPLCADLVTLSACETGVSDVRPGDDMTGLTRALLYAGASSALVTLWSVRADTTLKWMRDFYGRTWDEQGNKKMTEALAFQQATLDLRKEYPDPYYWAPFVLVGDWR